MKVTAFLAAAVITIAAGRTAAAQAIISAPGVDSVHRGAWNIGALVQGGAGLYDRTDYGFFTVGIHAGKVFTPNLGSGLLRGSFEYGVEVLPVWMSISPQFRRLRCVPGSNGTTVCIGPQTTGGIAHGASITPFILRYNLTHGEKWVPWIQGAGGVVWTNHKFPYLGNLDPGDTSQTGPNADTSVWNFTPQGGVGVHYFTRSNRSIDLGINAIHISSASLGDKNPGINSSLHMSVGYSWWK